MHIYKHLCFETNLNNYYNFVHEFYLNISYCYRKVMKY